MIINLPNRTYELKFTNDGFLRFKHMISPAFTDTIDAINWLKNHYEDNSEEFAILDDLEKSLLDEGGY